MPRTITGSYTLRPTKYSSYRSNDTFKNWFVNTNAPSNWTNNLDCGTKIGDNSDSTYYNDSSVNTSTNAKNCLMNLTVTSGTVPPIDYNITKVTFYWRNKTSGATNNSRIFRIWNTIYEKHDVAGSAASLMEDGYFGNMGFNGSTSSVSTGTTSIRTYSQQYTSFTHDAVIAGGLWPDKMAMCVQAYKTSHWTSFSSYQIYDVWYVVEYSYTEYEKTVQYKNDEGVVVTANGRALDAAATYQDYKGVQYPLIATVNKGYILDGYYLNGQKVSDSENYTFTFDNDSDELYCITKKRKIFVGDHQVDEVYIGTTPVSEIYDGDTCIWGLSDLYGDATAVG